jgi:septin family protein
MIPAPKISENGTVHDARFQSLMAARERLIRDEFERKYQELAVAVKQERSRYTEEVRKYNEEVRKLKRQLSNCICRG